ncbi:hypothetical protein MLD38_038449 [Melastoma candidum]|uniref:Uncharacterized protein n=1 Tax=Melastoma candidum TaxID=119954 RepID=A0ACB9L054_9MYRT|nr:hypothetical protein MLD38_038449 [Melastoma candidum]
MSPTTPEVSPPATDWGMLSYAFLCNLRVSSPLVQCITNFVSMDLVANVLSSAGASPAMIHCVDELPDFTPNVAALCINVGTLSAEWVPAMKSAAELAARHGKPWVLDPVAAGASQFRMNVCLDLVGLRPTVIRGNASEIIALSSATVGTTKGVDSSHKSSDAIEAAKSLARESGAVVAVTGAMDIITDGRTVLGASNGIPMLQKITATGCSVTALIAAFVALDPPRILEATACALSLFGIAAEMGMETARGPASLRMHMIDALHGLDQAAVLCRTKIAVLL